MISGLIPHRYAKALYKFALDNGAEKRVYSEMNNVVDSFSNNPSLSKIMSNPYIETADKEKLLLNAAGNNPGDDFVRFVKLILEHKREAFAYLMAIAYIEIYRSMNKISNVRITTASELPSSEMKKLQEVVEKSFPGRSFEFSTVVNPEIIGGFIIDVDSSKLDASISGELEELRQNLLRRN